jgi:RNA polymerase sigma-70 factor, ECF subfamily
MSESATFDAIETVARNSYGQLIAYLASRTGDVADAEDALSEALVAALDKWPMDGVPQKPEAWLLQVARNRMIDAARHNQVRQKSEKFLQQIAEEAETVAARHEHFPDETTQTSFCLRPFRD